MNVGDSGSTLKVMILAGFARAGAKSDGLSSGEGERSGWVGGVEIK